MSTPASEDLAKLIEFELRRLDEEKKAKGLNPWLLMATVAGLFWHWLTEMREVSDWSNVLVLWAIAILCADYITSAYRGLGQVSEDPKATPNLRFFPANRLLGATRPYLVFVGVKITIATGLIYTSDLLDGWRQYIWLAFFGIHLVSWLGVIVITLFDLPFAFHAEKKTRGRYVGIGALFWFQSAAISLLMFTVFGSLEILATADVRVALLAFAMFEVITLLLSYHVDDPARETLVQLRRAIGLAEIEPDVAKFKLDLVLHGADVTKFLQPRFKAYTDAVDLVDTQQAKVLEAGERIIALCREPVSRELLGKIKQELATGSGLIAKTHNGLEDLKRLYGEFHTRAVMVTALDPSSFGEVEQLLKTMDEAERRSREQMDKTVRITEQMEEEAKAFTIRVEAAL